MKRRKVGVFGPGSEANLIVASYPCRLLPVFQCMEEPGYKAKLIGGKLQLIYCCMISKLKHFCNSACRYWTRLDYFAPKTISI